MISQRDVTSIRYHKPVTTLEELDQLDEDQIVEGHLSAEHGDPEPGAGHSRAFHHGWCSRMMYLGKIPVTYEQARLIDLWCARERKRKKSQEREMASKGPAFKRGEVLHARARSV